MVLDKKEICGIIVIVTRKVFYKEELIGAGEPIVNGIGN